MCIALKEIRKGHEGIRFTETGVMNDCEPSSRYWEPNLGPLQEQLIFLTDELSLQPTLKHSYVNDLRALFKMQLYSPC